MRIAVRADEYQQKEILGKGVGEAAEIVWLHKPLESKADTDAYFDLLFDEQNIVENILIDTIPVFVNAVITVTDLLPANYIRLNAWNDFLKRDIVEIAVATEEVKPSVQKIMDILGWKFVYAPDEPGMIAARIISMIVNEAYFALGDKVSSKAEIDIAMKLGTNYPLGPFEWSEKIGLQKIFQLLQQLKEKESRYKIAPLLLQEIM